MNEPINVIAVTPSDRQWMASRTTQLWGADFVVSRGVAHRVAELPGFITWIEGQRVGVATYHLGESDCELVTLDALRPRIGIGTALVDAVKKAAAGRRLWLVTTNDNVDAIRFYQRRGFMLTAVYANAIEDSRKLKPQIPGVGNYGIPIRDELVFECVGSTAR
jgi:ribosomal protein S18 acetylase RimI-like enzyme